MATAFLFLLLAAIVGPKTRPKLLVALPDEGELFDPNDMMAVYDWLVGKLCDKLQEADAFDLVQEAVATSMPGQHFAWSRKSKRTLAVHLVYRVTDIRHNARRRMGFHVAPDPEDDDDRAVRARGPDTETLAAMNERRGLLAKAAEKHFENSPMVKPMLARILAGELTSIEEHARATGLTVEQANNVRDRIVQFVDEWAVAQDAKDARDAKGETK